MTQRALAKPSAMPIRITIITPSFNQCSFLGRTAQSVLSQQGDFTLRWLVLDGGSSDGTLDLLRSITDPRLQWASEADRGQAHAINKGLSIADADVVAWLNSDDLYAPEAIAAVAESFTAHADVHWLVGRCEIIDAQDRITRAGITRYKDRALARYEYRKLLRENFISQPAVFWRADFGRAAGPLDESLHWTMDYDLWLRLGKRCKPLILDRVLARFRVHPASKSGSVDRRQFDEQFLVAERYFDGDSMSRFIHRFNVEKIVWAYRLMRWMGM